MISKDYKGTHRLHTVGKYIKSVKLSIILHQWNFVESDKYS